jgi:PBSX family phage terminase large subunit
MSSNTPEIEFSPELFNPNFWHLTDLMKRPSVRFIWLYGGSSSGKTFSTVQAILIDTITNCNDTIVFRKQNKSIERTVYKDFKTIIEQWELSSFFKCVKSPFQIRCVNGAVIDFGGMDDSEKIKGISQYQRVYCNEVSAFEHDDFKQIRKRLRGKKGQQVILDFNPIDELHWIKTEVFDKEDRVDLPVTIKNDFIEPEFTQVTEKWSNKAQFVKNPKTGKLQKILPNMYVIRSTYLNNFWVVGSPCSTYGFYDVQVVADFEKDKKDDYNYYRIYALGEWGRLSVGGEFYKKFKPDLHVIDNPGYDPNKPLHISFDENVNPYLSMSIYQSEGDRAWKIDEICLKHPQNTLSYTLLEFKKRYPENKAGLFVYGDATSKKEDTKLEKGHNFFTIVTATLTNYNPVMRVPSANPPVAMRGNFINDCIFGDKMQISYKISDNCKNTINDYLYVKEDSDGTKKKEKEKDSNTGVTYERWGHTSDNDDYFLCQYFSTQFRTYQSGDIKKPHIGGKRKNFKM